MRNLEEHKKINHCPICRSKNHNEWLICEFGHILERCEDCGTGYLIPYPTDIADLYQDYGQHITSLPDAYFDSRLKIGIKKYMMFSVIKRLLGKNINLLDYGGGAGFFINTSQRMGIKNSYLFEPSENLRRTAIEKVGIKKENVTDDFSKLKIKFNFVAMLDVLEHLPQEKTYPLEELKTHMKPGAFLFGQTPNRLSLNLKIFGSNDPVICPPSHLLYFTKKSLDMLLHEHGFEKKAIFSLGLSTNSFFRKNKYEPSFVEQPKSIGQRLLSISIKILFNFFGAIMFLTGNGYQIIFLYKLSEKK